MSRAVTITLTSAEVDALFSAAVYFETVIQDMQSDNVPGEGRRLAAQLAALHRGTGKLATAIGRGPVA